LGKFKEIGVTYLEHSEVNIEGVNFFGSPFTPYYCGSAFQHHKKYDEVIWSEIPEKIDVLISHGPPFNILDKNVKGVICGSPALEKYSKLRKPKFHLFGHIHEARGQTHQNGTWYSNIAMTGIRF
jgi:Icc-related predicted phosphoesterase